MRTGRARIYSRFERFWHWTQALLILALALTGFEIHGTIAFFGFEQAVRYHTVAAWGLMILIAFAMFWHFTTGEWRQYVPTKRLLKAHCEYYLVGIFRDAPHPSRKSRASKLNPLQRLVYGQLKLLVVPIVVVSGVLYLLYRYPSGRGIAGLDIAGLGTIAAIHTAGAFFLVAFLIAHVYLITTGETLTSNLKAMLTGFEDVPDDAGPNGADRAAEPVCAPTI